MTTPANHSNQQHFIRETDYYTRSRALREALDNLSDQPDQALAAYYAFTRLRDDALPLLLACSEDDTSPTTSVQLPRAPSHLFLLPPIQDQDKDEAERYLVCLFPRTTSYSAEIQLIRWCVTPEQDKASRVSTDHFTFDHSLDKTCTLEEAPLDIRVYDQDKTAQIFRLTFRTGRLTITFTNLDTDKPTLHTAWHTTSPIDEPVQKRRSTYGRMPDILWARTGPKHWPDQTLLTRDNTRLTLIDSTQTGQITGADAPLNDQGKPNLVYLASNLSRLICLKPEGDDSYQLHHSEHTLGGYVEDVLVMADPEQPTDHIILASCHDGNLYLFNSQAHEESLRIRHWQVAKDAKISRIMGRVNGHLLALDQHQQLLALRLHNPQEFINLRNAATGILFDHYWGRKTQRNAWLSEMKPASFQEQRLLQELRLIIESWLFVQIIRRYIKIAVLSQNLQFVYLTRYVI